MAKPKNNKKINDRECVDLCVAELVGDCKKVCYCESGRLLICSGLFKDGVKASLTMVRLCMGLRNNLPLSVTMNMYEATDILNTLNKAIEERSNQ